MKLVCGVVITVLSLAGAASAQQLTSQSQLDSLLSSGWEDIDQFSGFNAGNATGALLGVSELDSTTVALGQGPGLVLPGVQYVATGSTGDIQWDGTNYFGSTHQEILADLTTELDLDYTTPVDAFGVDIRQFLGYGQTFTANVYDGSTLVGTFNGTAANDGSTQFFGWYNAAGITSVALINTGTYNFSPIINESSYGFATPAPEPATMVALAMGGLALLRRRQRR